MKLRFVSCYFFKKQNYSNCKFTLLNFLNSLLLKISDKLELCPVFPETLPEIHSKIQSSFDFFNLKVRLL